MIKEFQIETKRLILRFYRDNDFNALFEILSDKETMKYYPKPYDEIGVKRWIEWNKNLYKDFGFGLFAITLKENGKLIGDCGVTMQRINGWIRPEIGYHIHKDYWKQGYAKEAGCAVRDYIFQHTTFQTLYSYLNAKNIPSAATAKSIGMEFVCEYQDEDELTAVYSINQEKWSELPK